MVSAAVISRAFVGHHQDPGGRKGTMASVNGGSGFGTEHLSRVVARARSTVPDGGTAAVKRAQSAKSIYGGKRLESSKNDTTMMARTSSSSAERKQYRKKKGTANKLFEFGPLRFIGGAPKDEGKRLRPTSLQRQDTLHKPGLRAMLYGLTLKMEREEKLQKKLQRKRALQEEKAMLQAPTAPIDSSKFVAYVQERRKKRILFKGEFLMIQRSVDPQKATTEVAIRMGDKNQYPDTLPYDHNRVVLTLRPGIEDSHYINASYVNSWLHERAYVVTQSVRSKHASNELWRCVWELGSNTIVMLTKIFDFMRVVCLQYWPQTHFQFGEIHVELLETQTYAHFVIRTFRLRKTGGVGGLLVCADTNSMASPHEERIVSHFHFTEWELNSFPYTSAFIELRRRVRQWTDKNPVNAPIVVHCSNGGGRSGAFLAIDANLELLQRTGQLDVYEYGRTLANARQHLISSVEQYMFIYDVLCEAVLCNIQPMAMHQLKDRSSMYKARKDRELMELQDSHENKLLTMLTAPLRIGDCAGGHRLENRGKNRDVMVVPPDHARPYLQTLHGESKDYTYINAVEVDGFTRKSEFIVTEWPKQQTLDSFWTLIFDHNVHTVICLTNQPSDTKLYPPFIHNKGKKNYGPFTVEIVNFQQYPGLCSHMVKISKRPTEEVVEHRKWLFGKGKANVRIRRRPTLSDFLAECERFRHRDSATFSPFGMSAQQQQQRQNALFDDVNFRLQQRYWGRVHQRTPTPSSSEKSAGSSDGATGDDGTDDEKDGHQQIWDEQEDENELLGMHRRTLSLRERQRRPLSTGALLEEEEEEIGSGGAAVEQVNTEKGRAFAEEGIEAAKMFTTTNTGIGPLVRAGSRIHHRPKRDERGRRLGGEWVKRMEREGNSIVTKLNERGDHGGGHVDTPMPGRRRERMGGTRERPKSTILDYRRQQPNDVEFGGGTMERELSRKQHNLDGQQQQQQQEHHHHHGSEAQQQEEVEKASTCYTGGSRSQLSRSRTSVCRKSRSKSHRRRRRLFSQPNLGTLEHFEKTFMISEIMATGASQQQLEAEVRLCCIIQVRMWPIENKVPLSTTALIEVLKMTRSWRKRAPDRPESRPTIVMSHNGISRCGIFIAANVCIDQMEMDHEVDVFHAVKLIRINRPQLIDMKDEYKYLYDLMLHWYMTNPELRSHEPPEIATSSVDSESEDELLLAGGLSRSRSGSRRHSRSIQRSKSSRTSRRTQKTVTNSTLDPNSALISGGGGGKVTRTSSSVSTRTRREPIYLN